MTENLEENAMESVSATKRPSHQVEVNVDVDEDCENPAKRTKIVTHHDTSTLVKKKRWRTHQMAEDYIDMVGNLMYPGGKQGPFGFEPTIGSFPMERSTTLGYLTSPLRRPSILERWSPLDISLFEASMAHYGKDFYKASKLLSTSNKTTKDVIAFYYIWKKTNHYTRWKAEYVLDYDGDSVQDDEDAPLKGGKK